MGSRRATSQGLAVAAYMARCLAACGITVVSGMAQGIDSVAHEAALARVGRSIGVLGTGIDQIYPRSGEPLFRAMAEQGLLLSEFPPGAPPLAEHFPIRNRIISGLALGVLVVEAAGRSGSLITARLALEQNRDVYAVPGPALDSHCLGCQELVRQGARPVFSAEDVLRDLAAQLQPFGISEASLPEAEKALTLPARAGEEGIRDRRLRLLEKIRVWTLPCRRFRLKFPVPRPKPWCRLTPKSGFFTVCAGRAPCRPTLWPWSWTCRYMS